MGRSPSRERAAAGHRRPAHVEYKRPAGANDDGAPTVRNIIPWKDMEKELAKKLAAKAARGELDDQYADADAVAIAAAQRKARASAPPQEEIERAPDSGVRSSQKAIANVIDEPHRPLTYSVYTVSELDDVRPARMSMAAISTAPPPPMPSNWGDVWKSGLALMRAGWGCLRAPKPRPRMMDVCRVPLAAFLADARAALTRLPWRSIGWVAAVVGGALLLALLAVVTVAELTDDLKPATAKTEKKYEPPSAAAAAATGIANVTAPIELDEEPAPAAPTAAAAVTPKKAAAKPAAAPPPSAAPKPKAKKPKGPDIFIP